MWTLVRFLVRHNPFFTWLILTIVSIILLCQNNPYQRSVWFGTSNAIVGTVFQSTNSMSNYFGLRTINEDLLARTAELEAENLRLKQVLRTYADEDKISKDTITTYNYKLAHVVSNSISLAANYITIDKGENDGITQDQGVADQNGVVGIVAKVSDKYALVISVLNPYFRLSVSLKNSESFGSLLWDGISHEYALLEDLPRTVKFEKGDTVVTTSYSSSFPSGVPVGRVVDSFETDNSNFLTLRIKLFTDFNRINDVYVICNEDAEELNKLKQ